MQNYYILDDGKTQLLKFKKLDEFKDKVELVYSLKAYNNGFKYDFKENEIEDVRLVKFDKITQSLNIDKTKIILPKQSMLYNEILIWKELVNSNYPNLFITSELVQTKNQYKLKIMRRD